MPRPKKPKAKERLTAWVLPETKEALEHHARTSGLTMSETVAHLLEAALKLRADQQADALAYPRLEGALGRGLDRLADRMAYLLATAAMEAGSTQELLLRGFSRTYGPEWAKNSKEASRAEMARRLKYARDRWTLEVLAGRPLEVPDALQTSQADEGDVGAKGETGDG